MRLVFSHLRKSETDKKSRTNHIPLFYLFDSNIPNLNNHTPHHRQLTCINFAGWCNKHSPYTSHVSAEKPASETAALPPVISVKSMEPEQMKPEPAEPAKNSPLHLPAIPEYHPRAQLDGTDEGDGVFRKAKVRVVILTERMRLTARRTKAASSM